MPRTDRETAIAYSALSLKPGALVGKVAFGSPAGSGREQGAKHDVETIWKADVLLVPRFRDGAA